jgi:hypothetical protein
MQDLGAPVDCSGVGRIEIIDFERDLRRPGHVTVLGRIQREVDERTLGPRCRGMSPTGPPIVAGVIADMKVETERVAIEAQRSIEVGDLENDGDKTTLLGHTDILPRE